MTEVLAVFWSNFHSWLACDRVKNVHDERIVLPDKHRARRFPRYAVRGGDDPLRSDQSSAAVREAGRRPEHSLPRPVAVLGSRASHDPGVRPDTAWTCCGKFNKFQQAFRGMDPPFIHHYHWQLCCGLHECARSNFPPCVEGNAVRPQKISSFILILYFNPFTSELKKCILPTFQKAIVWVM